MVSTLKKLSVVAALGMAFASTAQASTFTIGSSFDDDIFVAPSSFVKTYTFDLSQAATITYSVTELFDNSVFNIDYLSFNLYNSNKNLVSGVLSSGIYTLRVTGDSNGSAGGLFNLNFAVAAVPEPETNALMLLGLGLMGVVAYRRKNMA
ncbi:MAG: PEP-CTERM sorting domain-containing protein [Methylophilus methylotrophus]|uniref:PEP-CTERM sorting domain-containing protein n=1 Tax=Methylophilus methylotrophus TaxID=17 RepID=A0A5C7WIP4_METME|nr:MAG: PEP-CTERM sorting domain-containing protein [Methylophilus methylotrophus]